MSSRSQPGVGVARAGAARVRSRARAAQAARNLGRRIFTTRGLQHLQERLPPGFQAGLQLLGAIAIAAGPGLLAGEVAAAAPVMGVLHPHELQILLPVGALRSEEHTSELQSRPHLVCRLLLEKKKTCLFLA